jgi:putative glutamine amidotransferase
MYPVVGITMDQDEKRYYINQDYVQSILQAGGVPLLIPFMENSIVLQKIVDQCDGLMLSGGEDVDPFLYGEEPLPEIGKIVPERDQIEINVLDLFVKQRKPILAICRGCQLVNVAFGGDLYQDIPCQIPSAINHSQKAPRGYPTHSIAVEKESLLYQMMGQDTLLVNSYHHQSIKTLASSLLATAVSKDGVIEAMESKQYPFLLGVQWHPEGMAILQNKSAKMIFSTFVEACRHHANF